MQPLLQLSNNYCNELFELHLAFLCRLGCGLLDCGLGRLGSLGRPGTRSGNRLLLCRRGLGSRSLGRRLDRRLDGSLGRGLLSSLYGRLGRSLRRYLLERGLCRGHRLPGLSRNSLGRWPVCVWGGGGVLGVVGGGGGGGGGGGAGGGAVLAGGAGLDSAFG